MNLVVSFQFFCLTYYLFEISGTTFILHNLHLSLFYWLPVGLNEDSHEDCDEYYEDSPSSTMNLSPGKGRTLYRIFIIFMFFRIESSPKAVQPQQISPKWRLWRTKVVPFLFQKSTSPHSHPKYIVCRFYYCAIYVFMVILLSFRQLDCHRLQIQVKKRQKMAKIAYFFKKKY